MRKGKERKRARKKLTEMQKQKKRDIKKAKKEAKNDPLPK